MTAISFTVSIASTEHTLRAEVELVAGEPLVFWCDQTHVRDLIDTHGLTSADLERFEAKAVEAFRLKRMASAVRERMAS